MEAAWGSISPICKIRSRKRPSMSNPPGLPLIMVIPLREDQGPLGYVTTKAFAQRVDISRLQPVLRGRDQSDPRNP